MDPLNIATSGGSLSGGRTVVRSSFRSRRRPRRGPKTKLLKEIAGRTVSDAVQEHVVSMRERGLRTSTVSRAEDHLRAFFQLDDEVDGKSVPYGRSGGL